MLLWKKTYLRLSLLHYKGNTNNTIDLLLFLIYICETAISMFVLFIIINLTRSKNVVFPFGLIQR